MDFHAKAELYVLRASEGGTAGSIASGFHATLRMGGRDNDGVIVTVTDADKLDSGESGDVSLRFIHPETQIEQLEVGEIFQLVEGESTIAVGQLLRVSDSAVTMRPTDGASPADSSANFDDPPGVIMLLGWLISGLCALTIAQDAPPWGKLLISVAGPVAVGIAWGVHSELRSTTKR